MVTAAMSGLIAVAAVTLVAWFAAGTIWNVRRGHQVLRWMQGGLPLVGERTTVRWLGSSVVEMAIREAKTPFSSLVLVIFLEPRDVPWMWALGRARGRHDTLIIRGVLRAAPGCEFEALVPSSWSGREALSRVPRDWQIHAADADGVVVHHPDDAAFALAGILLATARRASLEVARLSLRRAEPQLQLHVALPDQRQGASGFFEAVQTIAARAPS